MLDPADGYWIAHGNLPAIPPPDAAESARVVACHPCRCDHSRCQRGMGRLGCGVTAQAIVALKHDWLALTAEWRTTASVSFQAIVFSYQPALRHRPIDTPNAALERPIPDALERLRSKH